MLRKRVSSNKGAASRDRTGTAGRSIAGGQREMLQGHRHWESGNGTRIGNGTETTCHGNKQQRRGLLQSADRAHIGGRGEGEGDAMGWDGMGFASCPGRGHLKQGTPAHWAVASTTSISRLQFY